MSDRRLRLIVGRARHRWRRRLPAIVAGLGAATIGAGVALLFATDHEARSAFLLALGLALLLIGTLGDRIELESFELLGAKLRVREVVKNRLELAKSAERDQPVDPDALRRQAVTLQKLVGLYGLYEHVRRMQPPGDERTQVLDEIGARMQQAGGEAQFDPAEVMGWFHQGTDPLRVIALNLMLANERYRDFLAVLESIDAPHSGFEQYYGLLLAEEMIPSLDELQRRLLADAISRARRKRRLRRDEYRLDLSDELLAALISPGRGPVTGAGAGDSA